MGNGRVRMIYLIGREVDMELKMEIVVIGVVERGRTGGAVGREVERCACRNRSRCSLVETRRLVEGIRMMESVERRYVGGLVMK